MNTSANVNHEVREIYLDHAATTPIQEAVVSKMLPYMNDLYGNPSSLYPLGTIVRSDIEKARRSIKAILKGDQGNIFFTSGGTEANNWAISGVVHSYGIKHIITSPLEHSSVLATIQYWQTQGIKCEYVPVDKNGRIDYEGLDRLLKRFSHSLVSLMHGNNEIGNLTDVARVASLCKKHNALFHSDMVQTVGYYPIDLAEWGIDLCTVSAHKFYGPKSIGFLYVRDTVRIAPLLYGGQQEQGLRGGTENVAGIIGMSTALSLIHAKQAIYRNYLQDLKVYMIQSLSNQIPTIRFHGQCTDLDNSLCSIINVGIPRADKEILLLQLAMNKIAVSSGSACMSGSRVHSHVLSSIGVPKEEAVVRFSLGIQNTKQEIDYTVATLAKIIS